MAPSTPEALRKPKRTEEAPPTPIQQLDGSEEIEAADEATESDANPDEDEEVEDEDKNYVNQDTEEEEVSDDSPEDDGGGADDSQKDAEEEKRLREKAHKILNDKKNCIPASERQDWLEWLYAPSKIKHQIKPHSNHDHATLRTDGASNK